MEDGKSLYEVLGVAKAATASEVKRAYHALALKVHPDKNPGDEAASAKFQSLQKVYAILSDADKRAIYDETGRTDDDALDGEDMGDLASYFSSARLSEEDINAFSTTYRGSEEETKHVLEVYTRFKGDMGHAFDWIMLSDPEFDSHRFMDVVEGAIAAGKTQRFKAFTAWAKKTEAKARPANPLTQRATAGQEVGDMTTLVDAIRKRGAQQRGVALYAFASQLEAKYAAGNKKGKKAAKFSEPSEEEFLAAAARMQARTAGGGAGGSGAAKAGPSQAAAAAAGGRRKKGQPAAPVESSSEEEEESDSAAGSESEEEEEEEAPRAPAGRGKAAGRADKRAPLGPANGGRGSGSSAANVPAATSTAAGGKAKGGAAKVAAGQKRTRR